MYSFIKDIIQMLVIPIVIGFFTIKITQNYEHKREKQKQIESLNQELKKHLLEYRKHYLYSWSNLTLGNFINFSSIYDRLLTKLQPTFEFTLLNKDLLSPIVIDLIGNLHKEFQFLQQNSIICQESESIVKTQNGQQININKSIEILDKLELLLHRN